MSSDMTAQAPDLYVAILLSGSASDSPRYRPLWQEDIVLIHAASQDEAREKARRRGEAGDAMFTNEAGEVITWRFERVVDVAPLLEDDLTIDADLYTRHFRNREAYDAFEPLLSGEEL